MFDYPGSPDPNLYQTCGSLLVKPGCTLYGYALPDFENWKDTYHGPLLLTDVIAPVPGEMPCADG
jgi:hypothetical protein